MALIIEIKVTPSSGRQQFVLDNKSDQLKCYLKSAPERGKANEELIKFLSQKLSTTKNSISIIFGATSRKKGLKIDLDIRFDELLSKLGIERQLTI